MVTLADGDRMVVGKITAESIQNSLQTERVELNQKFHRAFETFQQTRKQSQGAIAKTLSDSRQSLLDALHHTVDTATQTTDHARAAVGSATQRTWQNVQNVSRASNRAIDTLSDNVHETVNRTTQSLQDSVQRVEQLNTAASETVHSALTTSIRHWLEAHPLIAWILAHPIGTLLLALLSILLGWGLIRAIAHLSERLWLAILQTPVWLGQWLLRSIGIRKKEPGLSALMPAERQAKLALLLSQLETMQAQQDDLLKEIQITIREFEKHEKR